MSSIHAIFAGRCQPRPLEAQGNIPLSPVGQSLHAAHVCRDASPQYLGRAGSVLLMGKLRHMAPRTGGEPGSLGEKTQASRFGDSHPHPQVWAGSTQLRGVDGMWQLRPPCPLIIRVSFQEGPLKDATYVQFQPPPGECPPCSSALPVPLIPNPQPPPVTLCPVSSSPLLP